MSETHILAVGSNTHMMEVIGTLSMPKSSSDVMSGMTPENSKLNFFSKSTLVPSSLRRKAREPRFSPYLKKEVLLS